MAGKKKSKKEEKAARKAEKAAKKAAKRAAAAAEQAAQTAVPKNAAPLAAKRAPQMAVRKPVKKAPKTAVSKSKKKASTRPVKNAPAARRAARAASKPQRAPQVRQQPESLRLRSAGPSFTVNDIHKSLTFYRDVLGFTLKERWEEDGALHGVEMVAGRVTFWLGQDDWKKGADRVKGQGFRMYCGTSQDVDAIAQRIRAAGGTLLEEPKDEPWGGRACAVVDPDGFTITFATAV
jgi:lactoylglutathione lyase